MGCMWRYRAAAPKTLFAWSLLRRMPSQRAEVENDSSHDGNHSAHDAVVSTARYNYGRWSASADVVKVGSPSPVAADVEDHGQLQVITRRIFLLR